MVGLAKEFFVSGGTLPLDSESYIERSADRELLEHLAARRYCYVLNARQMGKSSLSVRTIAKLRERGVRTVFIDLTQIGGRNVQSTQWYAGLTGEIGRGLGLSAPVLEYFKTHTELSPMQRFFGSIREVVLSQIEGPIVIFIDEIDATRNLPFDTDEFFAGIRECFNRRVQDDRCRRLTFCLIGVAVPNDLIRNPTTTPFNIGERIKMSDFSLAEIRRFARALGPNGQHLARQVHYWTNGQPFLTQSLCREIEIDPKIQDESGVDQLVQRMFFGPKALDTNLNLADVANRVLGDPEHGDVDKYRANMLSAYERARKGGFVKDDEANRVSVVLKLSGLLYPHGARLVVRNKIYHHVFDRAWIEANMPGQELVRQKQSFRRGLIRGIGLTALLGGLIGALGLLALRARQDANAAKSALDYDLYVSNMNSLRLFEDRGDAPRMASILDRSKNNSHRGFEWSFWFGRLHDSPEEYTLDYSAPAKIEDGFLSRDGRQICLFDHLARVAVIVDRKTKQSLGSLPVDRQAILATSVGFLRVDRDQCPAPVCDIATGKQLRTIGTSGFRFDSFATRPQSELVATGERDASLANEFISVWNVVTGQSVFHMKWPGAPFEGVVGISESGGRIAFLTRSAADPKSAEGARMHIWDTVANREVDSFPYSLWAQFANLSNSGRFFSYLDHSHLVQVRDVDAHRTVYSTPDTNADVPISVSVSSDDRSLVLITPDGQAFVREIPSGRLVAVHWNLWGITPTQDPSLWVGSSSTVRLLNLSPNGQGVVGTANLIRRDGIGGFRFGAEGATTVDRLSDPSLAPLTPIQLPPGTRNMTYNGLWTMLGHTPPTEKIIPVGHPGPTIPIPFHMDNFACGTNAGMAVVMQNDGTWYGISGKTGEILWKKNYNIPLRGVWMAPDGHQLIGTTWDGYVAQLDLHSGDVVKMVGAHKPRVTALSFSRDGKMFITGGGDGKAILWDTDTLKKIVEFGGNTAQEIDSADVSPDGSRVATCNVTGAWQIWDTSTGQQLTEIRASNLPLRSVLFSSDGKTLLTAGEDGAIRAWRTLDIDPTIKIPMPAGAFANVEFDRSQR